MAKVVFIQDIVYEYFGVMYISSYIKKHGHDCDVFIEYEEKNWLESVRASNADLIAFSVLSGSYKWALEKAKIIKSELGLPVIFGGVHVFLNPDKTIKEEPVDIICTGEGEEPMRQLCDSIDRGKMDTGLNGFWFKGSDGSIKKNPGAKLINELDEIPFADRSIYYKYSKISKRDTIPMLGSRGCPYTCTYCFIPSAKKVFKDLGNFIRERSAESIIKEIELIIEKYPKKANVHFVEDHFGNNREISLKVLQELSKMKSGKLKWVGAIRVERFNKEYYVKELAKTNHGVLGIAVECGDEDLRDKVLKRKVKNQEIRDAVALAKKYDIKFTTLNMLGLPGETFEQALMTLDFNIELQPLYANCYVYHPYPGTELQKYSIEHKLMDESVSDNLGLSFYERYWKDNPELNRIINLQRIFSLAVMFPKARNPLVYIAKNNWRLTADILFGIYYVWYLVYFYRLTPNQVFQMIKIWIKSKLAFNQSHPSHESIKQGEGQLYPNIDK